MEDILERRKKPMTKHILLFCKKTDKFKKNVLIFRLEGSKKIYYL